MPRLIDLSHVIAPAMPLYPGDASPVHLARHGSTTSDEPMASSFAMSCHAGTHIDLPLHFRAGEPALDAFPLERCWGRAVVVDVTGGEAGAIPAGALDGRDLRGIDFVLFRTGWERLWGTPPYYEGWPHLGVDLAERLAAAGLKGVGLDTPSLDPLDGRACHDRLAAAGAINIENLARLGDLPPVAFLLFVLPLKLSGTEASPVRAAALVDL
ncbi:MAG: cyclase family protein [Candidatus Krumholzibacteriia bacterium]